MQPGSILPAVVLIAALCGATAFAQAPADHNVSDLAKQTQNPVGDLTALPFQFNFNTGGDLEDQTFFNLNFQPVIPFRVGSWNVIARTIVPLDSMPVGATARASGVGDIQEQIYLSPAAPGKIIWGVGPMFSFPTATAAPVQTGTWGVGVGGVVLVMPGPWVLGGLINQFWPMSDAAGDPATDLFVFQPFVNYNFGQGWSLSFSPIVTANWNAVDGEQWTVPLGGGLSRTTVFNGRPMSLGVQYNYNVEKPAGSAGQQLRFVLSLLYPRRRS